MADRTVTYNFRGNFANLGAGLTAAGRSVADLGTKLTAADAKGMKMRAGLTSLGSTAGKVGLVAAAGFAVVVGAAAKFEQSMSNVSAATHETTGNMELLRDAAIEAGQATKFSATEAAGAIEELAKAGVSTADILGGGLTGALDLAAAGGLEVADAAQIAATALTQFKLSGEDVPHVADLLAAGAGKAQGDVSDLSMALKQSGLVAAQMGISIEETTGTLAAFASAGLLGSDAGTSFRTMLLRLANPTVESAALMEQLGIQAYDATGKFVGMESVAGQLAVAFENKTQAERDSALATIFGSDAIRAANVLYNDGATGIADWTDAVNDQGYAAETAAIKMDNLSGDLEQLKGSLETALIGAGSGSQGPLRQLVQGVTDVVNTFNKLPQSGQNAATGLLAVTAVLGGGLWFTAKTITGISNAKKALDDLGISASRAGRSLKTISSLAGAATVILAIEAAAAELAHTTDQAAPSLEGFTKNLLNLSNAEGLSGIAADLGDLAGSIEMLSDPGLAQDIGGIYDKVPFGIGSNFADIAPGLAATRQEARDAQTAITALDEALAGIVSSGSPDQAAAAFDQLAAAYHLTAAEQASLRDLLPGYQEALDGAANAATLASGATSDYGVASRQSAEASKAEADALREATKAMQDKTSATLAAFDAETGYRQALKDAEAQGKKNNAGINGSSKAALENRSALSGLASAWNNQSAAVKNNVERYKDSRKSFIDAAMAMGVNSDAAKRLADRILEIPKSRVTDVSVNGADAATRQVETLSRALSKIVSKSITVTANVIRNGVGNMFDTGGYTGDGGAQEPAGIVHKGEVVIPQRYVKRDWGMLKSRYSDLPGFASGGLVANTHARTPHGNDPLTGSLAALAAAADQAGFGLRGWSNLGEKELHQRERFLNKQERMAERQFSAEQDRLDALRDDLKALKDARRDFARSVTSNFQSDVFGQVDLAQAGQNGGLGAEFDAQVQAYAQAHMESGQQYNQSDWIQQYLDTLGASQLAALQAQAATSTLNQDTTGAGAFSYVLDQLRQMGLTGGAYQELAASGNYNLANAYLNMGPAVIAQLMADFQARSDANRRLGNQVGDAEFGRQIRQQTRAVHRQVELTAEVRDGLKELNRLQHVIDRRFAELNRIEARQAKETGQEVGKVINDAVGHGQRRG